MKKIYNLGSKNSSYCIFAVYLFDIKMETKSPVKEDLSNNHGVTIQWNTAWSLGRWLIHLHIHTHIYITLVCGKIYITKWKILRENLVNLIWLKSIHINLHVCLLQWPLQYAYMCTHIHMPTLKKLERL